MDREFAVYLIRSYECSMCDPLRNDFVDNGYEADQLRRELMLESVASHLECDEEEAEKFYEEHRRD